MKNSKFRPQVFISHSSQDTWVAKQLASHIQRCGAKAFLDAFDLRHGDDYDQKLSEATRSSTEALVLLTPAARKSSNVWMEVGSFWGQRKRLVCVLYGITIQQLSNDPRIPAFVKKGNQVDLNNVDEYFQQLRRRIARKRR